MLERETQAGRLPCVQLARCYLHRDNVLKVAGMAVHTDTSLLAEPQGLLAGEHVGLW